jgi:glycosyltransferase involved in cell wall biosynthesis
VQGCGKSVYQLFELIVVNDGSTDNGLERIKEIKDERIRIVSQDNAGQSAARNKGIKDAKYDLIAFLDADDQWEPEILDNFARVAEKYPDAGMIGAAYKIINLKGEVICPGFGFVPEEEGIIESYFKAAVARYPLCSSAVTVRKKVFEQIGGFSDRMRYGEDNFMWSKIALNYPVAFINKYLAVVYRNADNRVSAQYYVVDDLPLFDYIKTLNKEIKAEDYFYISEFVYEKYLLIAGRYLRTGNKKMASLFIEKAKETRLFKNKYLRGKLALYFPYPLFRIFAGIWRKINRAC